MRDGKTRLYNVWRKIFDRINNKNSISYKYYGGKGITICKEWLDFKVFKSWALSNGYADDLFIDRIDSNKNYDHFNCRFVTRSTNNRRKSDIKLTLEKANRIRDMRKSGKTYSEIAAIFFIDRSMVGLICRNKNWKNENTNEVTGND